MTANEPEALKQCVCDISQSSYSRRDSMKKLFTRDKQSARDVLIEVCTDDDYAIRQDAVEMLAVYNDVKVIEALTGALNDKEEYVQRKAIGSLRELKAVAAISALEQLLEGSVSYFVEKEARTAVEVLREIKPVDAAPGDLDSGRESEEIAEPTTETAFVETVTEAGKPAVTDDVQEDVVEAAVTDDVQEDVVEAVVTDDAQEDVVEAVVTDDAQEDVVEAVVTDDAQEDVVEVVVTDDAQEDVVEVIDASDADAQEEVVCEDNVIDAEFTEEAVTPEKVVETAAYDCATSLEPVDSGLADNDKLTLFFADKASEVAKLYADRKGLLLQIPEFEQQASSSRYDLQFQHADKDDDIALIKAELADLKREISKMHSRKKRLVNQLADHQEQCSSLLNSVVTVFSKKAQQGDADKEALLKKQIGDADNALKGKNKVFAARSNDLEMLEEELSRLQQISDRDTDGCDSLLEDLWKIEQTIEKYIVSALLETDQEAMTTILTELSRVSRMKGFYRHCSQEINHSVRELKMYGKQMKELGSLSDSQKKQLPRTTNNLSNSIANGFVNDEQSRSLSMRIRGSLHFEEESGFFSGFSNASGSASGTGSANVQYTTQEIRWNRPADFGETVDEFCSSWETAGKSFAEQEYSAARYAAAQRSLAEYTAFLRNELEPACDEVEQ